MVIDSLKALGTYTAAFPQLKVVEKILKSGIIEKAEPGAYKTDDSSVRYNISTYTTHEKNIAGYEVHERDADVQIILAGKEYIDMADSASLKKRCEYDAAKDIQFFDGELQARYFAYPGEFILLLPGEAHEPCLSVKESGQMKKVVFKLTMKS